MNHRTPLYAAHVAAGAKIVPFGGWDMPLHYGSQLDEHHAVRREWGIFDVSHMTVVDLAGADCRSFLSRRSPTTSASSPKRGRDSTPACSTATAAWWTTSSSTAPPATPGGWC